MEMTAKNKKVVYWGTGRRKTSVARVRMTPGTGKVTVNDRSGDNYFNLIPSYISALKSPLETLGLENEYDLIVRAHGGGLMGQSEAVKLGVARALCELSPENRQPLKAEGYLTRDPRAKERKKYGLHKARKAPQYSKR